MTETAPDTRPLIDAAKPGDVAMLVTVAHGTVSSRPLTVASVQTDHLLFMIDQRADWLAGAVESSSVHVTISTGGRNDWVAVNGKTSLNRDPALIRELFNPAAGAYFDGEDDPNIVILDVEVTDGEYWSAPGGGPVGRLIAVVSAKLGRDAGSGDHGAIT